MGNTETLNGTCPGLTRSVRYLRVVYKEVM